jgi:hypothetical protein
MDGEPDLIGGLANDLDGDGGRGRFLLRNHQKVKAGRSRLKSMPAEFGPNGVSDIAP